MDTLPEYEFQRPEKPPHGAPPHRLSPLWWIAGAVGIAVLAGVVLFYLRREETAVEPAPTASVETPSAPAPLGAPSEAIEVPPLEESDALVRTLVRALSSHPQVAIWLATDGLIRNFVVAVENISLGQTPAAHVRVLQPAGGFRVMGRGGRSFIDVRSYERYDNIAAAVASIDADGAARAYSVLKPRMQEAYRELGHPEPFDQALERAIVALLQVPVLEGPVALEPRGAADYQYADPRIERLTPAQKQLARMGPANVRTIQAKLREIAQALGIPADRLPR